MSRVRAATALAVLLAGCAPSEQKPGWLSGDDWVYNAPATEAAADPYFDALVEGYREAARFELAEYDWNDASAFLDKAEAAAARREVPPFSSDDRPVGGDSEADLRAAEAELNGYINSPGARLRAGEQIGKAQVLYDWWHEEAEEGFGEASPRHNADIIKSRREAFEEMMFFVKSFGDLPANMAVVLPKDGVTGGIEMTPVGRAGDKVLLDQAWATAGTGERWGEIPTTEDEMTDAFAAASGAMPPPSKWYCVLFPTGSAKVGDGNFSSIWAATWEARNREGSELLITGQADRPGDTGANLALSSRRAAAVRASVLRQLQDARGKLVSVRAIGERTVAEVPGDDDPACAGGDQRRVVIQVR